jgi:hypothetical protein
MAEGESSEKKKNPVGGIGDKSVPTPDWSMRSKGGAMSPVDALGNVWAIDDKGQKYIAQKAKPRGSGIASLVGDASMNSGFGGGQFEAGVFAKGHAFTQAPKDDELQGALAGQTMGNFSSIPASNASVMPGSKSIKR